MECHSEARGYLINNISIHYMLSQTPAIADFHTVNEVTIMHTLERSNNV